MQMSMSSSPDKRKQKTAAIALGVVLVVAALVAFVPRSGATPAKLASPNSFVQTGSDSDLNPSQLLDPSAHGTHVQVNCPSGYVVTGCGLRNSFTHLEPFWQVHPNGPAGCFCYNYYGAQCYATCAPANLVVGHHIVQQSFSGNVNVHCPAGRSVTGCGLANTFAAYEPFKQVYPISTTACHCYNYHGGTCYAICASNVKHAQVVTNHGRGQVYASCPNSQQGALGCGFSVQASGPAEVFPFFHSASRSSCVAYSYYGVTTYALCGEFESPDAPNAVQLVTVAQMVTPLADENDK